MVTKKIRNFFGLTVTFLGIIVGIFLLTTMETIFDYVFYSLFTLLCFCVFISFLYSIIKKEKNEKKLKE